ncbi:hypothetical protein [Streptomyces sp. NPDC029041]|uniref:hypothetical protein n=1 Tax=Streptomyces sp. NPDC029041 TaxID=3155727 RepID=UPI0033C78A00
MNEEQGQDRLAAHWAVLGKHPGQVMGYEVLDGSLPPDRAESYLWAAATGTPESREPAAALPWRVFLGSVRTDPTPVCATVETTWDGSRDGTGAPSYTWRLFLLDWSQAGAARLTWSALDQALPHDGQPPTSGRPVPLSPPRPQAGQLAAQAEELGFEWTARVAALLLDNRRVAIVPPSGTTLPEVTERVRVLDAVCALLPYGCRAWLSGATWAGQSDHALRLVFTATPKTGQVEVWPGTGSPPDPQGTAARTYLSELLRLRAKPRPTAELVEHLLGWTEVIPVQNPAEALRALRDADLLDSVIEAVRQGRGDLHDVQRLLERYPVESLGEVRLAVLLPFLARCAQGPEGGPARALLLRHWSRSLPHLLAEDVVAGGGTKESFERARGHLGLMHALEAERPGALDELLTALVSAPQHRPEWTGYLVYWAEQTFGRAPEAADTLLIRSREAGLAWLSSWLEDRTRDLAPLVRLATRAVGGASGGVTGWPRFAAALTGRAGFAQATAEDAEEFVGAHDDAWETALELATAEGRPEVVDLMWPRLREVARSREASARLLPALDRLAPAEGASLAPEVAADADLLRALHAHAADGSRIPSGMPRARRLTDTRAQEAYAAALSRRVDTDQTSTAVAVEALLGDEPDPHSWRVLQLLMAQRVSTESLVRDGLARRLTEAHARWLRLDLPDHLVRDLSRRHHLSWLTSVWEFGRAVREKQPMDRLARLIATAAPGGRFSPQLLSAIADFIRANGPWIAYSLAAPLHRTAPNLDLVLYSALRRSEGTRAVADLLDRFHAEETYQHQRLHGALTGTPPTTAPLTALPPAGAPPVTAPAPPQTASPQTAAPLPAAPQGTGHKARWPVFRRPDWFQGMRR